MNFSQIARPFTPSRRTFGAPTSPLKGEVKEANASRDSNDEEAMSRLSNAPS